ncbi:MAG: hypothetical protein PHH16_00350 [Candidatus Gracilibacteria bacterium]|nr:hypothetical protein [Candidatus Gracilibacteria bacterium]
MNLPMSISVMIIKTGSSILYRIYNYLLTRKIMISYIIGAIGLIFTITTFYLQNFKAQKSISYIHLHKDLNEASKYHPKLRFSYSGIEAENVIIHDVAFFNDGKEAVEEKDFSGGSNVKITLSDSCKILGVEVWYKSDENTEVIHKISKRNSEVLLGFNYLNKGDGFIVKIITDSKDPYLHASGGILNGVLKECDIKRLKDIYPIYRSTSWILIMAIAMYFVHWILGVFLSGTISVSSDIKSTISVAGMIATFFLTSVIIQGPRGKFLEGFLSIPFTEKRFYGVLVKASYNIGYEEMVMLGIEPDEVVDQKELPLKY